MSSLADLIEQTTDSLAHLQADKLELLASEAKSVFASQSLSKEEVASVAGRYATLKQLLEETASSIQLLDRLKNRGTSAWVR